MLGQRLRRLRNERGISANGARDLLALRGLGLSRKSYWALEKDLWSPNAAQLLSLAQAFEVPMDYFTDPFRLDVDVEFSWRLASAEDHPS